jgi:hypothetical protein
VDDPLLAVHSGHLALTALRLDRRGKRWRPAGIMHQGAAGPPVLAERTDIALAPSRKNPAVAQV